MDEENNRPQGRISRSFIFSILFVAAILGLIAYFIFSNMSTVKSIQFDEFATYLAQGKVNDVQLVQGETKITINGHYTKEDSTGKAVKTAFTTGIPEEMYNTELDWYIDIDGDGVKETISKSVTQMIVDATKNNEAGSTPKFVITVKDPYEVTWFDRWGPTIILIAASTLLLLFLFSRMSTSVNSSNRQAMDFNRSRARRVNTSKIKFEDVAGADEEKAEMEELVHYLKEPKKYTKLGAKLPKGVLLVGPPGCGKTLLAKAVAGEAGVPFFSISGSDFVEMFVGVGAGRVRDMFRIAKENAPCLVFIDEIDAVGRQRGAGLGGGNDEREQTLNQLLVEMDGFNDNSGIIVIAATNRDDVLDPALLRAGRFDRKITVSLPDVKGREAIFKVHAKNKKVASEVNFENLSKRTVGFSGADIENIMNEAAILAIRENREEITVKDIDEAIDRRFAGPAKKSRALTEQEKWRTAYHESGHAIVGLKYPHAGKVQKITIIPRGQVLGWVLATPDKDRYNLTKGELIADIVLDMGGRSAEEIFCDDIDTGAYADIKNATARARAMVCEYGMSDLGPIQYERDTGSVFLGRDYTNTQKNFSAETATKIDAEIRKIIDFAHAEAQRVIKENREDVELLAKTLVEREQITAEEIEYLLEHRHLKEDEKPVEEVVQPEAEEVKFEPTDADNK